MSPDSKAIEPQTEKDLTIKGPGVPDAVDPDPTDLVEPDSKSLALSSPRHDVPVAVSVVGYQNTHTPPDLKVFDHQGRPRD